jgi:hypothetical protein
MLFNLYRRVGPRGKNVVVVRLMSILKGGQKRQASTTGQARVWNVTDCCPTFSQRTWPCLHDDRGGVICIFILTID